MRVVVLGGSGFVGRCLCSQLSAAGHQVTVVSRQRDADPNLLVLPRLNVVRGHPADLAILRTHFQRAQVVINLVGILNETGRSGQGFERTHVDLADRILDACRQSGVPRLLHMSSLNADPAAPSHYLRSKGIAEQHVLAAHGDGLAVTCFRPSVIFGPGDGLLQRFAELLRRIPLVFPLACPDARMQPVFVGDVAQAFVSSIADSRTLGRSIELCGPRVYRLAQIVALAGQYAGVRRIIWGLPPGLSRLQARLLERLPGKLFSMDNYQSLQQASVCGGDALTRLFGIRPTALEDVAPAMLAPRHDRLSRWRRKAGR
ncbi:MAG: complex I NDUFA9 subunit family protein [Gammaproteobacteria bacterium]|nr:complex I NDUFA9 subunit family protein [Gammaproteobacteria bacterium]